MVFLMSETLISQIIGLIICVVLLVIIGFVICFYIKDLMKSDNEFNRKKIKLIDYMVDYFEKKENKKND